MGEAFICNSQSQNAELENRIPFSYHFNTLYAGVNWDINGSMSIPSSKESSFKLANPFNSVVFTSITFTVDSPGAADPIFLNKVYTEDTLITLWSGVYNQPANNPKVTATGVANIKVDFNAQSITLSLNVSAYWTGAASDGIYIYGSYSKNISCDIIGYVV